MRTEYKSIIMNNITLVKYKTSTEYKSTIMNNITLVKYKTKMKYYNRYNVKKNDNKNHTIWTIPKSNIKTIERGKMIPLVYKYMSAHFLGLVQALHKRWHVSLLQNTRSKTKFFDRISIFWLTIDYTFPLWVLPFRFYYIEYLCQVKYRITIHV